MKFFYIGPLDKMLTRVNDGWAMSWIENRMVCCRPLNLFERIRYFPKMILWQMTQPLKNTIRDSNANKL